MKHMIKGRVILPIIWCIGRRLILHLSRSSENLPRLEAGGRVGRAARKLGVQVLESEDERGFVRSIGIGGARNKPIVAAVEKIWTLSYEEGTEHVS